MKPEDRSQRSVRWAALALVLFALTPSAAGLTSTQTLDALKVSVYAPDWIWQKQNINILVVLENTGSEALDASLSLSLPPGKEDHFTYEGGEAATLTVPAGGRVRHAFTNITARDGVARQEYVFALTVQAGGGALEIPYPVRTVRGAAVSPGKWAAFLPAGIAAAWCLVFMVVMARFSERRAWATPGLPADEPEVLDAWITKQP